MPTVYGLGLGLKILVLFTSLPPGKNAQIACSSSFFRSVCASVLSGRFRNCEHDILKPNKPISMQIGRSGLQSNAMKRAIIEVRECQGHRAPKWVPKSLSVIQIA